MNKIVISEEKRRRIQELNDQCRLRHLMESHLPTKINESIVVMIDDNLIKMPKKYCD